MFARPYFQIRSRSEVQGVSTCNTHSFVGPRKVSPSPFPALPQVWGSQEITVLCWLAVIFGFLGLPFRAHGSFGLPELQGRLQASCIFWPLFEPGLWSYGFYFWIFFFCTFARTYPREFFMLFTYSHKCWEHKYLLFWIFFFLWETSGLPSISAYTEASQAKPWNRAALLWWGSRKMQLRRLLAGCVHCVGLCV